HNFFRKHGREAARWSVGVPPQVLRDTLNDDGLATEYALSADWFAATDFLSGPDCSLLARRRFGQLAVDVQRRQSALGDRSLPRTSRVDPRGRNLDDSRPRNLDLVCTA